jgi:amino acid transporter
VAGSDESGMIGTSRLGYALAADGLFPKLFAKIHPRFKTPYASIIIQSVTALAAALLAPLLGGLSLLISVSVFFLAIAYVATCASVFTLRKKFPSINGGGSKWRMLLPAAGIVFSVYLITQCSLVQIGIGVLLLLVGVPIYVWYSPKRELKEIKQRFLSEQNILRRLYRQEHVFLAHILHHLMRWYRRLRGKPAEEEP